MTVSKRAFIRQSMMAALGLAMPWPDDLTGEVQAHVDGLAPSRKFKMQLNGGLIGVRANQLQLIELASKFGFEAVTASASYLKNLDSSKVDELKNTLRNKNLEFGLGLLNLEFRKSEDEFKKVLAELPSQAGALQKAGVTRVMTWIMSNHSEMNYLQNFRFHTNRLRALATVLSDYNLRFGLEYVGPKSIWSANKFPFIHTMNELKELIGAIDKPNVGIHLDTAHWFSAAESVEAILSLKNEDIVGCDLNDAVKGMEPPENQPGYHRELPCTTGVIDISSFLKALVTIGYDGFIQAEPFNEDLDKLDDEEAARQTAISMKKAVALV